MLPRVLHIGPALDVKGGISVVESTMLATGVDGYSLRHLPTMRDTSVAGRVIPLLVAAARLLSRTEAKADLFHIHFSKTGSTARKYAIASIAKRNKIPYILHCHSGGYPDFFRSTNSITQRQIKSMLSDAHKVACLSDRQVDFFVEEVGLNAKSVIKLRNPVPPLPLTRRGPQGQHCGSRKILLAVGRIGAKKGSWDLLHAFRLVLRELPPPHPLLVMVGDGSHSDAVELAQNLGIYSNVQIVNWADRETLAWHYDQATVFALPSHSEGLPMTILEALSAGLPVVASSVGAIPEVISASNIGTLHPPGHIRLIADAICAWMQDDERRDVAASETKARAMQYSPSSVSESLRKLYDEVLCRPSAPNAPSNQ